MIRAGNSGQYKKGRLVDSKLESPHPQPTPMLSLKNKPTPHPHLIPSIPSFLSPSHPSTFAFTLPCSTSTLPPNPPFHPSIQWCRFLLEQQKKTSVQGYTPFNQPLLWKQPRILHRCSTPHQTPQLPPLPPPHSPNPQLNPTSPSWDPPT